MQPIKEVIQHKKTGRKYSKNIYQIVLSDKQKVRIYGEEDYLDFRRRISKYSGKGLIYTKHGFVNPSFIVSISRDLQAERDVWEDYSQYGLPFTPPEADFEIEGGDDIKMLN